MDSEQYSDSGVSKDSARICIFSQRNVERTVVRCVDYEFEDVICEVDDVEVFGPTPYPTSQIAQKLSNRLLRHFSYTGFNPGFKKFQISRDYELFMAICMFPYDLRRIDTLKEWRERSKIAVCWIAEIWAGKLRKWKPYLKILSKFDYIVTNCSATVQPLQDMIQRPCFYMPPGVDTIRFSPYPDPPMRSVDVYSIGRKSPVTHCALSEMAQQKQIFYVHDTIDSKLETSHCRQHRRLIANIAKRSRYFLANIAKIDMQFQTHGQSEIGYRFLEGAAAGTIMIGEPPENDEFKKHFDWPDAVIKVPFDSANIAEILEDLDSQPERLEKARKNNIIQSLLRHDHAYRWRAILDIVGIEPRPALIEREKRLKKLAEMAETSHEPSDP